MTVAPLVKFNYSTTQYWKACFSILIMCYLHFKRKLWMRKRRGCGSFSPRVLGGTVESFPPVSTSISSLTGMLWFVSSGPGRDSGVTSVYFHLLLDRYVVICLLGSWAGQWRHQCLFPSPPWQVCCDLSPRVLGGTVASPVSISISSLTGI